MTGHRDHLSFAHTEDLLVSLRTAPLPLPDPARIEQWPDLTDSLRALHLACGRPTYDALSARCGLPKSAISYLIGKNPVRRPSEAAVLRFVRGCLAYRGVDETEITRTIGAYRRQLLRMTDVECAQIVPDSPPVGTTTAHSPVRTRRVLPVLVIVVLLLVGGTAATWAATHPGQPASAPPKAVPAQTVASPTCQAKAEAQDDVRLDRTWRTVFYCANARTVVFAHPRNDGNPIATLETTKSWFTCWTYGRTAGGTPTSDVWYYTQGDDDLAPAPGWEDWGFVSASALAGQQHPLAGVAQECDFAG